MPLCLLTTNCRKLFVALLLELLQALLNIRRAAAIILLLKVLRRHIGRTREVSTIQLRVTSLRTIRKLVGCIPQRIGLCECRRSTASPRFQLAATLGNLSRRRGTSATLTSRSRGSRRNLTARHWLGNPRHNLLTILHILGIGNLQRRHLLQECRKLVTLHAVNTHGIDQRRLLHGVHRLKNLATVGTTIAVEQRGLTHSLLGILKKRKRIQRNGCEYCHADSSQSSRDG